MPAFDRRLILAALLLAFTAGSLRAQSHSRTRTFTIAGAVVGAVTGGVVANGMFNSFCGRPLLGGSGPKSCTGRPLAITLGVGTGGLLGGLLGYVFSKG